MTARELSWQDHGLCAEVDPDLFFPEKGGGVQAAYRVCAQCPVKQECLDFALDNHIREGIWGGTSDNARRAMHDTRRAAALWASSKARWP